MRSISAGDILSSSFGAFTVLIGVSVLPSLFGVLPSVAGVFVGGTVWPVGGVWLTTTGSLSRSFQ